MLPPLTSAFAFPLCRAAGLRGDLGVGEDSPKLSAEYEVPANDEGIDELQKIYPQQGPVAEVPLDVAGKAFDCMGDIAVMLIIGDLRHVFLKFCVGDVPDDDICNMHISPSPAQGNSSCHCCYHHVCGIVVAVLVQINDSAVQLLEALTHFRVTSFSQPRCGGG
jgi:hypothetical protein